MKWTESAISGEMMVYHSFTMNRMESQTMSRHGNGRGVHMKTDERLNVKKKRLLSRLTGTSFQYHLVGDFSRPQKRNEKAGWETSGEYQHEENNPVSSG